MRLNSERPSFYGVPSRGTRYSALRPSSWSPYRSVLEQKQKTVPEPETPSHCKYSDNRKRDDPVVLHSRNKEYLCSQKMVTLTRWLQQNGIPFSDQWPKERIATFVSRNYSMATPMPKRCERRKRPNRTVSKANGIGYTKSKPNQRQSVSAPFGSLYGQMIESLGEIHENEEENEDEDDLMKSLNFSAISVKTQEELDDELMDAAWKMV